MKKNFFLIAFISTLFVTGCATNTDNLANDVVRILK